jgi:hypothetical protein
VVLQHREEAFHFHTVPTKGVVSRLVLVIWQGIVTNG